MVYLHTYEPHKGKDTTTIDIKKEKKQRQTYKEITYSLLCKYILATVCSSLFFWDVPYILKVLTNNFNSFYCIQNKRKVN